MIDYDVAMKVLETKQFTQHNIAGLISGIIFIVLFQSGETSTVEENKHTHTPARAMAANLVKTAIREKRYSIDIYPN